MTTSTTGVATGTVTVHVRYFAGAGEAVGVPAEALELRAGATLADLRAAAASGRAARAERVLEISSFLVDDVVREDAGAPLTTGREVRVDVLPPFAGG